MIKKNRVILLWLSQIIIVLFWAILLYWEAKNPIASRELGQKEMSGVDELLDTEVISIIKKRRGI